MLAPPPWTAEAACNGLATRDRDYWHPDDGPDRPVWIGVARRVCRDCPVRLECVTHGLDLLAVELVQGVFGGLAPEELRQLARDVGLPDRKVAQHGTRARYVEEQCRCPDCRAANARAEAERRTARGRPAVQLCAAPTLHRQTCGQHPVPGSPFCVHHGPSLAATA